MSERIWGALRKTALYKSTYTLLYFTVWLKVRPIIYIVSPYFYKLTDLGVNYRLRHGVWKTAFYHHAATSFCNVYVRRFAYRDTNKQTYQQICRTKQLQQWDIRKFEANPWQHAHLARWKRRYELLRGYCYGDVRTNPGCMRFTSTQLALSRTPRKNS